GATDSDPGKGRLYLSYADFSDDPDHGDDTNIYIQFSDNAGADWSSRARVNDDAGQGSQFNPSIAVDQATGDLALAWYDARADVGGGTPGDTDTNGNPNDDTQFFTAVSNDGGMHFSGNVPVSIGTLNTTALPVGGFGQLFQYGDYTGLAFYNRIL